MADAILVLNAGSSSLKFSAFLDGRSPAPLLRGQPAGRGGRGEHLPVADDQSLSHPRGPPNLRADATVSIPGASCFTRAVR